MEKFEKPIYVTKAFLPPLEDYVDYLKHIWDTHWLTNNGEFHRQLEKNLENYLGVNNITLFVNGHSALDIAIKALDLTGEVITTPFTFASTTHAIVMNGLTPVFCDINLKDFTIDVNKIENLITEKTSAIVAVHVYGYPCDIYKINQIAQKYQLKVIYDAAHAFGVKLNNKGIGNYGDVSMFSFHATKVFNTIEGGALTFQCNQYKGLFDLYKNFGITGQESVDGVGLNAKMNEFQAAMGIVNLKYVDEQICKRKEITELYRNGFKNVQGIYFTEELEDVKQNYAYFPILIDEKKFGMTRNQLFEILKEYNIFARKYFYPLSSDYKCFEGKYKNYDLENARYVTERIMTLPIYCEVNEIEKIIDIIKNLRRY
ncbi:DegT/DnrJ/EryC1/StrS family aminotransferase [Desulforamulus aeronauticus]|uniref:dTDP-4-amino-4,6-dideoxygalactose transaminase n=1 Tax=Desulforamulus aeronauticus DSM 10349 TaxID=1121421 RepID=A0A1M6T4J2_9FIRM|nr:DegT/DnrJ/EryC1/StrS family aminotransferase [Desulforamulus aeronauticus]SHK51932.1 dTDP-4-amino-4,6-dideoxygalactose transaminase [Desulforamulus aeronauticus DSM 10349]